MRVANDSLISGAQDWSTAWTSMPILLQHAASASIQLFFSGSPAGMLKLQCSNDAANMRSDTSWSGQAQNWTDIEGSEQIIAAAGDHTWQLCNVGYMWVRVSWAPASGTSSLDSARFTTKGV